MKKNLSTVLTILALILGLALFACADSTANNNNNGGGDKSVLTGVIVTGAGVSNGAATLTLTESGGVTLQLTATPQGSKLPANVAITWTVEEDGEISTEAEIIGNGLFSTSSIGTFTVKASAKVGGVTKTGQAIITVRDYDPGNAENPGNPVLTGVTVSGAASAYLPQSGGACSVTFSAAAQGSSLPANITYTWSVEKDGAATVDASVTSGGVFSSAVTGTYTVKAAATVGDVTKFGEKTVTVNGFVAVPETLPELITFVEQAVKDVESVKKSIKTVFALREAKKAGAGDAQRDELLSAYLQSSEGYNNAGYSVVTATGPIWSAGAYANAAPYYLFTMTVAFSLETGKIADVIYAPPEVPVLGRRPGNTGTTTEPEYWQYWTTTAGGANNDKYYLDIMEHFVGMDAKRVATFTKPPNTVGILYRENGVNSTPIIRSNCTETGRNATSSIVECAKVFIASEVGKAFA